MKGRTYTFGFVLCKGKFAARAFPYGFAVFTLILCTLISAPTESSQISNTRVGSSQSSGSPTICEVAFVSADIHRRAEASTPSRPATPRLRPSLGNSLLREALSFIASHAMPSFRQVNDIAVEARRLHHENQVPIAEAFLTAAEIEVHVHQEQGNQIPQEGRAIIASTHPTGIWDGLILLHLAQSQRADVKMLILDLVKGTSDLDSHLVKMPDTLTGRRDAIRSLDQALSQDNAIAYFPAGAVAQHVDADGVPIDSDWSNSLVRMVDRHEAPIILVGIGIRNSDKFYSRDSALAKRSSLPAEAIGQQSQTVWVFTERIEPEEARNLGVAGLQERARALQERALNYQP